MEMEIHTRDATIDELKCQLNKFKCQVKKSKKEVDEINVDKQRLIYENQGLRMQMTDMKTKIETAADAAISAKEQLHLNYNNLNEKLENSSKCSECTSKYISDKINSRKFSIDQVRARNTNPA